MLTVNRWGVISGILRLPPLATLAAPTLVLAVTHRFANRADRSRTVFRLCQSGTV